MAKKGAEKQQQKDFAKLLYLTTDDTQNVIAERVGITPKTLKGWIDEGMWQYLRTSLLTSKGDSIRRYYAIIDSVLQKIENTEGGYGDTKLADMSIKYTAALKNLETETSAGQMFETGMLFIKYVLPLDPAFAKEMTNYFDAFIQNVLNKKF